MFCCGRSWNRFDLTIYCGLWNNASNNCNTWRKCTWTATVRDSWTFHTSRNNSSWKRWKWMNQVHRMPRKPSRSCTAFVWSTSQRHWPGSAQRRVIRTSNMWMRWPQNSKRISSNSSRISLKRCGNFTNTRVESVNMYCSDISTGEWSWNLNNAPSTKRAQTAFRCLSSFHFVKWHSNFTDAVKHHFRNTQKIPSTKKHKQSVSSTKCHWINSN